MSTGQVGRRIRSNSATNKNIRVTGVDDLFKKIDKLARWSIKDSEKLRAVGHRVGNVYAGYLGSNVKDYGKNIFVTRSRKDGSKQTTVVSNGQLRRSAGTWLADRHQNTVLSGPRTNAIGRRKTRGNADGWFAHIVEKGDFGPRFGGKHRTQNTGVFSRGIKATQGRSEKLQTILLRQQFKKYTRKL